jgi:hypothetical protein
LNKTFIKMRLTLYLSILLLAAPVASFAQDIYRSEWTNGWQSWSGGQVNDSVWAFNGADLHEGGYRFFLVRLTDSSWLLKGHNPEGNINDRADPVIGKKGDRVVYRVVDGHPLLIFRSAAGVIDEVLVTMEPGGKLEDLVTGEKIAYQLGGEYVDARNGTAVTFYPGRPEVRGLAEGSGVYYFPAAYDYPENVLCFGSKKTLFYERTDSTLELYTAVGSGDEEYKKGKKVATLRRTGWLDPSRSHLPGHYPFASVLPLTDGITIYFSKAELRIMRNEMYARHGYVFKSSELQAYFTAQPWYKPVEDAGEAQLSELEKLNARILAETTPHK